MKEIIPVEGADGRNAFYIINFEGGGFQIISADKRTISLMAYSETGGFGIDRIPESLNEWLNYAKESVDSVRIKNVKYYGQDTISRNLDRHRFSMNSAHSSSATRGFITPGKELDPENPDKCPGGFERVGPLTTTQWRQDLGFNLN